MATLCIAQMYAHASPSTSGLGRSLPSRVAWPSPPHRCPPSCHTLVMATATVDALECKQRLDVAMQGLDRGIFGTKAAQLAEITSLLEQLEAVNPLPDPVDHLDQVEGDWKLLFSTISIKGSRRTKLGLREIISLGDFVQSIDTKQSHAVNKVHFSARGLALLEGALTITASYEPASPTRVNIAFQSANLVPEQLERLFQKNYDLLLSIFNPEGWLEVTYLDDTHRVGRDDKGNVFYLERC